MKWRGEWTSLAGVLEVTSTPGCTTLDQVSRCSLRSRNPHSSLPASPWNDSAPARTRSWRNSFAVKPRTRRSIAAKLDARRHPDPGCRLRPPATCRRRSSTPPGEGSTDWGRRGGDGAGPGARAHGREVELDLRGFHDGAQAAPALTRHAGGSLKPATKPKRSSGVTVAKSVPPPMAPSGPRSCQAKRTWSS